MAEVSTVSAETPFDTRVFFLRVTGAPKGLVHTSGLVNYSYVAIYSTEMLNFMVELLCLALDYHVNVYLIPS